MLLVPTTEALKILQGHSFLTCLRLLSHKNL